MPIMHRHFFGKPSQNPEYVQIHRNERRNPFDYAIREWTNTCMDNDGMIEFYLIK